ncbi:glycosyltransferase [Thiorhodococcus minor]|uniref:Glycosyltransferase family 4 protein n=1 Tax=Thiorhodococcus minor TaxID=57489 RepID=A0A6M0JW41_9GAMM|nr:glycosyltransferase [Thiorhodococcus minor]NEV60547.1 glycosyltransferase family 4 protein [Thiorhodococcus minor]
MTIRVLHLAPHFGGGVGTVLRALIAESQRQGGHAHRLACLEAAAEPTRAWAGALGVQVIDRLHWDDTVLRAALGETDLVHLHWWHHPLLNALMHRSDLPLFRCVLWTHVNGHHPPQNFPLGIADYPDLLVLATPWSLKAPALVEPIARGTDIRVVRSSAGIPSMPLRADGLDGVTRVGYVGTVDPIKMHPDFVRLCLEADLPGRIVVAGGPGQEALRAAARAAGAEDRFEILGPIDDVPSLMSRLDVFAYPLSPHHYGTGEQVLLEAVAAGAAPVVLGTDNERSLLEHLSCGIMTESGAAFAHALRQLATDPARLSIERARCATAATTFSGLRETTADWHGIYSETMARAPAGHRMPDSRRHDPNPHELLLAACQGTELAPLYARLIAGDELGREDWGSLPWGCLSDTRGSCFHYCAFFDDPALERIAGALAPARCADARSDPPTRLGCQPRSGGAVDGPPGRSAAAFRGQTT